MASPEQNRVGGARPSGAGGVRNLLAMFEKSSSSPSGSPAPTGSNPVNPAVHEQSPGPRPLGRVRTSFVAVQGNSNPILGLQKAPSPSSPMSPVVSVSDGGKLFGGPLESASEKELGETAQHRKQPLDEANLRKHDLETRNGYTAPSFSPPMGTALPPSLENTSNKQVEAVSQNLLDSMPMGKDVEEPAKPVKAEPKPKPKPVAPKTTLAPKSPTKSMFTSSKMNKAASATKSGKNLTLPPSKSTTTSPLPSPALPKSPVRSAASSSSGSRVKPSTTAQATGPSSARTRTAAPTSTTAITAPMVSKPRQPTAAIEKAKVTAAKKVETKVVREPSKPPTIRSSAFAPAAKLAAEQKVAAARSRPPSSASARNRSPPGSSGMRRGNSGTGSAPGRKDQRSPQRPQTSAAIRNPNRTSVGSVTAVPGASGGDFLSRMMRPTTSSAGKSSDKSSDKKPGPMNPPQKRPASVASTSRRREKSLPPPTGRLHKQTTGEGPKVGEKATTEVLEQSVETPSETPAESNETQNKTQEAVNPSEEATNVVEAEVQESEDGCQSPTTTTSSTTLVHEGEGKDEDEILAKE